MGNKGRMYIKRAVWGLGLSLFLGILECMTIHAEAKKSDAQEEAEECVRDYYEALSEGDVQKANEPFDDQDDNWRVETIRAMKECGMEKYDVLQIDGYPVGDEESEWLFVVTYEIWADGIETGMPGLTIMRARRADGGWVLDWNMTIEGELEEIWEKENIRDKVLEWDQKYADAAAKDEKIGEWVQRVSDVTLENILEQESSDIDDESGEQEEQASGGQVYRVKPGDCLWKIAAEQLGEGTRWTELYRLNQDVIGEDPDLILPGIHLLMP